jgi:two-component system response regulator FixJ
MIVESVVHIVDDDPEFRESLDLMVGSVGLRGQTYCTAEEFLENHEEDLSQAECLVLYIRMPGTGGLKLQDALTETNLSIPVIMITAYGDVSMAVRAMGAGAVDFIEKPFNRQLVLERIFTAIEQNKQEQAKRIQRKKLEEGLSLLTNREREVMDLMISGEESKQTSARLRIDVKTVLRHRANVLKKMQVSNAVELVHLAWNHGPFPVSRKLALP